MNLLHDTHAFLWWMFDDPKLSIVARQLIGDSNNGILVSAASVWEVSTKYRLGRLPEAREIASDVPGWIEKAGFDALPISPRHAQLAGSCNATHGDPFDRMLAAQARLEAVPLISTDRALKEFEIELVW